MKAYKKKFNVVEAIKKTPQLRVKVNSVAPKRVKFSLPGNATDGGAICNEEHRYGKSTTCDNYEVKASSYTRDG